MTTLVASHIYKNNFCSHGPCQIVKANNHFYEESNPGTRQITTDFVQRLMFFLDTLFYMKVIENHVMAPKICMSVTCLKKLFWDLYGVYKFFLVIRTVTGQKRPGTTQENSRRFTSNAGKAAITIFDTLKTFQKATRNYHTLKNVTQQAVANQTRFFLISSYCISPRNVSLIIFLLPRN